MDSTQGKTQASNSSLHGKQQHLRSKWLPEGSEMKIISWLEPKSIRKHKDHLFSIKWKSSRLEIISQNTLGVMVDLLNIDADKPLLARLMSSLPVSEKKTPKNRWAKTPGPQNKKPRSQTLSVTIKPMFLSPL